MAYKVVLWNDSTKEVVVTSQIPTSLVKDIVRIFVQSDEPSNPEDGDVWIVV